jgi:hypothetical protein
MDHVIEHALLSDTAQHERAVRGTFGATVRSRRPVHQPVRALPPNQRAQNAAAA